MGNPSTNQQLSNRVERLSRATGVSRRGMLGMQALLLAGVGTGGVGTVRGSPEDVETFETTVTVSDGKRGGEHVPETLFGRFAEHYGDHEAYPGLYAEYVTNTSFVEWVQFQGNVSHMYGFDEVGTDEDVPFPWEPIPAESVDGVEFERPE